MKKLVLKKDVVEALSSSDMAEVQGGLIVNTSTRPDTNFCPIKPVIVTTPPATQSCPSQCYTSACCW